MSRLTLCRNSPNVKRTGVPGTRRRAVSARPGATEYGGIQGIKSEDLLHSALGRPMNKLADAEPGTADLCQLAAAYAYGLASNHPFNDRNKRTAWSNCVLFLKVNGTELTVSSPDVIEHVVWLASGQLAETEFATWLRSCCISQPHLR